MKKSEKLFMLINKIDENIISEAKPEAQKPNRITIEKRGFPIKETLAAAACFAVLAGGIFAAFKFRIDMKPVDSNVGNSNNSYGELDDEELREILRELCANAAELDGMFTKPASGENTYRLGNYDTGGLKIKYEYCPVSGTEKTQPNGLFTMPQSLDEMRQFLITTFTERAVEYYMSDTGTGTLDGSSINADASNMGLKKFLEADGQLFRGTFASGSEWYCDPETAHVVSKTDKTIRFSYSGADDWDNYWDDDIGTIVYENGGWRLDYFHEDGFIPELPTELTEEDIELQGILSRLTPADKIDTWFSSPEGDHETITLLFAETGDQRNVRFTEFPDGAFNDEDNYPHSLNELETLMLKYFTQSAVDQYMEKADHAEFVNITGTAEGLHPVITSKPISGDTPSVLEIDGKLYHAVYVKGSGEAALLDTAKVTEKTDTLIKYSCVHTMNGSYYNVDGVIEYERGGWRVDPFYTEPDAEADNKELQKILTDILPNARELDGLFTGGIDNSNGGDEYVFIYDDVYKSKASYYRITGDIKTKPDGKFTVPKSRQGFEELLSGYFSKRAVKSYLEKISSGTMTQNSDGTYLITTDQGDLTTFIEINGQLYGKKSHDSERLTFDPSTASVISKTDNTIKFGYTTSGGSQNRGGVLVYENSWKLNHFYWGGFISEYPTEFTAEDEELQKILNELAPNYTISGWFNTAGEYSDAYYFEFPESDTNFVTFYYKLPTGKFANGKEKYPQSYDELEALLLKYFTQETADYYMEMVCRGTKTEISKENFSYSKGSYSVTTDRQITNTVPRIIEIDGEMYYAVFEKSGSGSPNYDTAKVISKTDDSIKFSYIQSEMGGYFENSNLLKYERGGWRMAYVEGNLQNLYRIDTNILSDLGLTYDQMVEKHGKLKTNTYKGVMFENSIWLYGWKSENGSGFYADNDHTNPGKLPEAGGCNVISGVIPPELLTGFISPMTFDKLCERYGFTLIYASDEQMLSGYTATFTHPLYPDVTFSADTGETKGSIDDNTLWWIFLDVDCKDAKPII